MMSVKQVVCAVMLSCAGGALAEGATADPARGEDLVRFADAYHHHLVAMDTKPLTDVFLKHEEKGLWQTEFWGKYMHSAVPLLKRFPNADLERHVRESSRVIMDSQLPDGYIGNYKEGFRSQEGWDIWGNKYTLLGLLYYYDYSHDARALACARKLADYLIREVGPQGKRSIVTTGCYLGMPSCSVLEPIVWLYRLTGEKRYLAFAEEIVRQVGYDKKGPRLVTQALAGVPVAKRGPWKGKWWSDAKSNAMKAYEMMSCHQGLLDYCDVADAKDPATAARVAEIRKATLMMAEDIRTHEINLVGGAASVEFWHGGAAKETRPHAHESETCVTITWMRLCERLYGLTHDRKWITEFRKSFFNVYLGALSPDAARFASYPAMVGRRSYFRSHCGMATDCCNQNGMRGFVSALNLGVIAGKTPEEVRVVESPRGEWTKVEKNGHVAFKCGELVMVFTGDAANMPLEMEGFKIDAVKARLIPFAQAGKGFYRTWMETYGHPWEEIK